MRTDGIRKRSRIVPGRLKVCLLMLACQLAATLYAERGDDIRDLRVDADRLARRMDELGRIGRNPEGGIDRVAFSPADAAAREHVASLLRRAGLAVRTDAAGNLLGRREGDEPELAPILFGSHVDSVPSGGNFDGGVGVMAAVECAQVLHDRGITTRHPLEVVVFADEEGSMVGSRGMAGSLTPETLDIINASGLSVREGLAAIGGNPEAFAEAVRRPGEVAAFLELHVEQGGVLESLGLPIGVVEGIVGVYWWDVIVEGMANHAGTTPMAERQDALVAAAHLILAVRRVVTSRPGRAVGTVGRIRAEPGAPNVIPGRVEMSLELRDLSEETVLSLLAEIEREARAIGEETATRISMTPIDATARPTPTDPGIRRIITDVAAALGLESQAMPSGAGHDAQNLAPLAPVGMIFVPSVGAVSHSPRELTRSEDLAAGANVLLHTILEVDQSMD